YSWLCLLGKGVRLGVLLVQLILIQQNPDAPGGHPLGKALVSQHDESGVVVRAAGGVYAQTVGKVEEPPQVPERSLPAQGLHMVEDGTEVGGALAGELEVLHALPQILLVG